jgi:hypothetical protein
MGYEEGSRKEVLREVIKLWNQFEEQQAAKNKLYEEFDQLFKYVDVPLTIENFVGEKTDPSRIDKPVRKVDLHDELEYPRKRDWYMFIPLIGDLIEMSVDELLDLYNDYKQLHLMFKDDYYERCMNECTLAIHTKQVRAKEKD